MLYKNTIVQFLSLDTEFEIFVEQRDGLASFLFISLGYTTRIGSKNEKKNCLPKKKSKRCR